MTIEEELAKAKRELAEARDYINSAPTPEERSRRKQELYHILYRSPKPFSEWLKEKKQ